MLINGFLPLKLAGVPCCSAVLARCRTKLSSRESVRYDIPTYACYKQFWKLLISKDSLVPSIEMRETQICTYFLMR